MRTTRTIPAMNWTRHIESAIRNSKDEDEIIVSSNDMREYVKLAIKRQCPDKHIVLTVQPGPSQGGQILAMSSK